MPDLRHSAAVVLGLLFGFGALADDAPVSLDSVDSGNTVSLDSLNTGKTRSLDSVDTGETVDQDTLDVGRTDSLDAADTGHTVDQDTLDTGTTESLSSAERAPEAPPSLPSQLPEIRNDALRAQAQAARDELMDAEQRYAGASAKYSEMRAHDFPRGDAAAAIVQEYEASHAAWDQAKARYAEILQQANPAAVGD